MRVIVVLLMAALIGVAPLPAFAQDQHAQIAASLNRIEAALATRPSATVQGDPVDELVRFEYSMMRLDRLQAMRARVSGSGTGIGIYGGRSALSQATGCGPISGMAGGALLSHAGVFGGAIGLAAAMGLGALLCL